MKHVFKDSEGRILAPILGNVTLEQLKELVPMEYVGCKEVPSDSEYMESWCQCEQTGDIIEDLDKVKEVKKAKIAAEQKAAREAMKEAFIEADLDGDEATKTQIRTDMAANKADEAQAMSDIDALTDLQEVKDYQLGE